MNFLDVMMEATRRNARIEQERLIAYVESWLAENPDYVEVVTHPTPYEKFAGLTIDGKALA